MSWKDAARKALERAGALVEEDQRGLRVSPREGGGFSALVLLRRLHMSLDRKVEVLGAVELPAALVNLFTVVIPRMSALWLP